MMKKMSFGKRTLAMLLAIVMIVGLLPMSVLAAETTVEAPFNGSSDTDYLFFATDRHENTSVIGNLLTKMEAVVGDGEIEYVGLGGDMVNNTNSYNSSTVLSEVTKIASNLDKNSVDLVYAASHDVNCTDDAGIMNKTSGLLYETDHAYVYGVVETDVQYSDSAYAPTASAAFYAWATNTDGDGVDIDTSKVIIVLSHRPLHAKRGDNVGAGYWHNVLNQVATGSATGGTVTRNVIFLHGHNHTVDSNEYYYAVGDTMSIESYVSVDGTSVAATYTEEVYDPELASSDISTYGPSSGGSTSSTNGTDATIYYTYATAGYLNANSQATLIKVTDTTVTLDKYTTSSYSTLGTVTRVGAKTPTKLYVTGTDTYNVGETFVAPTVKVAYSDGSEATVSADDYTVTGTVDTSTAGTYTLTYSCTVGGYSAQAVFTVNVVSDDPTEQTYYSEDTFAAITATAESGTVTNIYDKNNTTVNEMFENAYWYGYSFALTEQVADTDTTITLWLDAEGGITSSNLAVYYYNTTTGAYEAVTGYTVGKDSEGVEYITISNAALGTYVYGTPAVVIPDGATLGSLTLTPPDENQYFDTDAVYNEDLQGYVIYVDISGMVVTANYVLDGVTYSKNLSWNEFDSTADGYALIFDGLAPGNYGEKTVTVSYGGKTATFNIWLCAEKIETGDVTVSFDEAGVIGMTVDTGDATETVTNAVAGLINGDVTVYDFSLTYAGTATALTGKATVTLPIPDGVTNPVVYYVSDDGETIEYMTVTKGDGVVTFTTTHFSTYVVGESAMVGTETEVEVPGSSVTTYTPVAMTVYKLVTTPESGKTYLIVNSATGTGYGLDGDTTGYATTAFDGGDGYYSSYDEASQSGTAFSVGSDVYLTTDGAYLWTAGSNSFTIGYTQSSESKDVIGYSGTSYSYTLNPSAANDTWSINNNTLTIYLQTDAAGWGSGSDEYAYFYLTNSGSTWSMSTSGSNVYFYEPVTIYTLSETTTGTQTATYGMYITYPDADGNYVDTQQAITAQGVLPNETLQLGAVFTSTVDGQTPPTGGTWTITSSNTAIATVDNTGLVTFTGTVGETLIQATYSWEQDGVTYSVSNYVAITVAPPDHYSIQLHYANLTQVASGATFDSTKTYYVFNSTTKVYEKVEITAFEDGVTYYTTPVVQGDEIDEIVALKGIEAGDRYPIWAVVKAYATADDTAGTDLGELGDDLTWSVSDTSIATIDTATGVLTFTGNKYGTFTVTVAYTGADGKVITDTITISVTESLYVVPGDGTDDFSEYPNEGAIRFDKTATAVGNFSETGIAKVEISMTGVPYTTGSEIDVVVMLDMTGSMSDNGMEAAEEATKAFVKMIVQNEDGTYNDNRIAVYAFNSGDDSPYELVALDTIDSDTELTTANTAIDTASDKQASGGTPYEEATKQCYDVLQAAKTTDLPDDCETAADYNRQQFCLFMSDGGPTTYYGSDSKTYYGGNNTSGDVTIASMMTNYTSTTASSWSMDLPTEYYTDLMKADDVTIYTVGLLLQNVPSNPAPWSAMSGVSSVYDSTTDSLTTVGTHYYFTSEILKQMATSTSHYIDIFTVDNAANATAKFQSIAQKIVEAAKDVVVEDKIGNNYSINLALPYGVTTDETDGLNEFYIQVVEYQLDSNKERTGDPYVKEKFLFNADGSIKSHTVDGTVTCEGTACTHITQSQVTTTYTKTNEDGTTTNEDYTTYVTTAINGTYFTYVSNDDGEILTWKEDKISTTELALQYFAHLDNSSDAVGTNGEIPAGTYYTNEYATLTYTNYNGNQVQQEFPVPQMTWNGAQVSYVFYLVNDAGQPVNRAGRVVPFSEAVYVTDVYTYAIVWNSLEQSAGLEADYLAKNLVPDCYALYDDDAEYFIHVYEDEEEDNLNNHFTIGGDVTDDYNTTTNSWTNAKTTYVFNTKADGTKYNTVGTYINSDGTTTAVTTYLCKGDGTVTSTIEQVTDKVTAENFADGTYFVLNSSGNYVQAAAYDASATYYAITSASYVAADGETQWTPGTDDSTSGGTLIGGYLYYIDENNEVYTIVQKSNGTEVETGFDFHNTTVAFAVVWKPELVEDTVVIDFGLDVVIDVITNDALAAGVVGVRTDAPSGITQNSGNYDAAEATSVDVSIDSMKIGTATVENLNSVRFSLDKTNGMQFTAPVTFYYEADVNYYNSSNVLTTTSMYSMITIIPATTVYYEDEYVTLKTYTKGDDGTYTETAGWDTNSVSSSATQDVDRPDTSKLSESLDADNVYGYDSAYKAMSEYSMGSAAVTTITSGMYATATFTFYGTGFDVISLTSNDTSLLTVKIYSGTDTTATSIKNLTVDTYYGYTKDADGNWVVDTAAENALYQIPVISYEGLAYGQYTVVVKCAYNSYVDHQDDGSYKFYMDAIRIYDPTGVVCGNNTNDTDGVVSGAYDADSEAYPTYQEIRNNIIAASNVTVTKNTDGSLSATLTDGSDTIESMDGAVFIDGNSEDYSISDYVSYGPNNELYLAQNQAIAFKVNLTAKTGYDIADVQIGMKSANGASVTYTINSKEYTITTTTDMYYSIWDYAVADGSAAVVTIKNTSDSILSLTNIKVTYEKSATETATYAVAVASEDDAEETSLMYVDEEVVTYSLMTLRMTATDDEVTEDDTTDEDVTEDDTNTDTEAEEDPETDVEEDEETEEPEEIIPEEPEVFTPELLQVLMGQSRVQVGETVMVAVLTSADVEQLVINGQVYTYYRSTPFGGQRLWTVMLTAEEAGEMTIEIVACNAEGVCSEAVVQTLQVENKRNHREENDRPGYRPR